MCCFGWGFVKFLFLLFMKCSFCKGLCVSSRFLKFLLRFDAFILF